MRIEEYQGLAMRTSTEGHDRILNGCLGLIGESGEVVDVIKKWLFQSGDHAMLPKVKLIDECGDVLWYCAELCTGLNIELSRVVTEAREKWKDHIRITGDIIAYWAYRLTWHCNEIYGHYYGDMDSKLRRPQSPIPKIQSDGSITLDANCSMMDAPIAYPMQLDRWDQWRFCDTVTLEIAEIVYLLDKFLAKFCDSTLEEAMERNIEKLKMRYPDGFDPERSLHRNV